MIKTIKMIDEVRNEENMRRFNAIVELTERYTTLNRRGCKVGVSIIKVTPGVIVVDAGAMGEKVLTLIYAEEEIFAHYTELGAQDAHLPHIPKPAWQGGSLVDVSATTIILDNDPIDFFDREIAPRLDYLIQWDETTEEWVTNSWGGMEPPKA